MTLLIMKASLPLTFCLMYEPIMNIQYFPCAGAYAVTTVCKSSIDPCVAFKGFVVRQCK